MKEGNSYNMSANFALLLIGTPKAGKTIFGTSFPTPGVVDCDNNLAGAIRYHTETAKADFTDFFYDDPNKEEKEDGSVIARPMEKRWDKTIDILMEMIKDPRVKTIFCDGLTLVSQYLEAVILANSQQGNGMKDLIIAGEKVMNQSHWNPFKTKMFKLIMAARSAGKPFIMSCHEHVETNDSGAVIAYRPQISGQLRSNLAGLFTDCWRCETAVVAKDAKHPMGVKYSVRFAPRTMHQIGNSLNIKQEELDITALTRPQMWKLLAPLMRMDPALVS